jgi:hypothetical protein
MEMVHTPFLAPFLLPNSFEKNLLCTVMQVEHTLNSKYHPPTFKNFKIFSNEFHSNLTLGIESVSNKYEFSPKLGDTIWI